MKVNSTDTHFYTYGYEKSEAVHGVGFMMEKTEFISDFLDTLTFVKSGITSTPIYTREGDSFAVVSGLSKGKYLMIYPLEKFIISRSEFFPNVEVITLDEKEILDAYKAEFVERQKLLDRENVREREKLCPSLFA